MTTILLELRRKATGQANCQSDSCQEEGHGEQEEEKVMLFVIEATKLPHDERTTKRRLRASENE